jgi:hypothetical protein
MNAEQKEQIEKDRSLGLNMETRMNKAMQNWTVSSKPKTTHNLTKKKVSSLKS